MPNIWDEVLGRIEAKVNRHSYYTWFKPTSFVSDQGTTIHVRVPNTLFRDWLTKHYSTVINESLAELNRAHAGLLFLTDGENPPDPGPPLVIHGELPDGTEVVSTDVLEALPVPVTGSGGLIPR